MKPKWETEGDRAEFYIDDYHCLIVRVPHSGHLWGYVGVPNSSPLAGRYEREPIVLSEKTVDGITTTRTFAGGDISDRVRVHGGITFCGRRELGSHWYFGFDCAHSMDYCPVTNSGNPEDYKDIQYVTKEIKRLVEQLREIENDIRRLETHEPVGGMGT